MASRRWMDSEGGFEDPDAEMRRRNWQDAFNAALDRGTRTAAGPGSTVRDQSGPYSSDRLRTAQSSTDRGRGRA